MVSLFESVRYALKHVFNSSNPLYEEDVESEEDIVFYRCSVCGYKSKSVGFLHGHMEKHTAWYSFADVDKFKEWTEKIVVTDYRKEDVEEWSEENF